MHHGNSTTKLFVSSRVCIEKLQSERELQRVQSVVARRRRKRRKGEETKSVFFSPRGSPRRSPRFKQPGLEPGESPRLEYSNHGK